MRKWPDLATATLQQLADLRIEARLDPQQRGQATYDLYFDGHRIGAVDAEGEGAVVKIVFWPGLNIRGLVAVRVSAVPDLPKLRASLITKMPPGFEDAISSDSARRDRAARANALRMSDVDATLPPVDDETRLAWEANRRQAAFWKDRPESVTSISDQTGAESRSRYCAKCHLETSHVLTGQHSTGRGKNWRGWQCTVCSISTQRPTG